MGTETSKGQRSPVCWTRSPWRPALGLSIGLSSAVRGPRGRIGSPAGGYWLKLKKRQRSRDPHVAWLRSCHTPVAQSMDRIKVMCRRAIKTGRVEPRRSRARNSGSCQISRPSGAPDQEPRCSQRGLRGSSSAAPAHPEDLDQGAWSP